MKKVAQVRKISVISTLVLLQLLSSFTCLAAPELSAQDLSLSDTKKPPDDTNSSNDECPAPVYDGMSNTPVGAPSEHWRIQAIPEKSQYKPGERIKLEVWIRNDTNQPRQVSRVSQDALRYLTRVFAPDGRRLGLKERFSHLLKTAKTQAETEEVCLFAEVVMRNGSQFIDFAPGEERILRYPISELYHFNQTGMYTFELWMHEGSRGMKSLDEAALIGPISTQIYILGNP